MGSSSLPKFNFISFIFAIIVQPITCSFLKVTLVATARISVSLAYLCKVVHGSQFSPLVALFHNTHLVRMTTLSLQPHLHAIVLALHWIISLRLDIITFPNWTHHPSSLVTARWCTYTHMLSSADVIVLSITTHSNA